MAITPTPTVRLLTLEEAARQLGISERKTFSLIKDGLLEQVHIGKAVRIPSDAVEVFIRSLRAGQPA